MGLYNNWPLKKQVLNTSIGFQPSITSVITSLAVTLMVQVHGYSNRFSIGNKHVLGISLHTSVLGPRKYMSTKCGDVWLVVSAGLAPMIPGCEPSGQWW